MPWGKWETGLPDDFDLEVSKAYFGYSAKLAFQGGEPRVALHLEGKAEGGSYDTPTVLADETALLFAVGDKWMVTDDGAKVVHPAGPSKTFNAKSAIAKLIDSAVEAGVPLQDRGEPEEAGIWVGLTLHFLRHEEDYGTEIGKKMVLGVSGFSGSGKAPAKAATKAAVPAGDDVTAISDIVGGPIMKRLQKLAAESEDYDTFAAEAVELPKVKDSDEVQDIVLDTERGTAVWEALRG